MSKYFEITPSELLDYTFNWTKEIGTDTIQSSTIVIDNGLELHSTTNDTISVKVVLKNGVLKRQIYVTNIIVTASGNNQSRSMLFKVVAHKLS